MAYASPFYDNYFNQSLAEADPEVYKSVRGELARQQDQIELIASENVVSRAVLEAAGSVLTNKYAEGYSGRRYYGGCEYVDIAEDLAVERAKELFDCAFANVQPHAGCQANGAVYQALATPGDTIMGMGLAAGGHLTHGAAPAQSGKWFNAVQYGVREEDGLIDYDEVERLAGECKPKMIIAGGSAYSRVIDFARFRAIADKVGAYLMVDMAHFAGLVAAGVHPSPLPHAHVVTTTHPQDPARPAWRHDPQQRSGHRQEDQFGRFPGSPGWPPDAHHRRQGGGVPRGHDPGIQANTPRPSRITPRCWPRPWSNAGSRSFRAEPIPT